MKQKSKRYPKAYNNSEFLNSPEARTIRIVSEFLEPARRFRKEGIRESVVFFGSARIQSKQSAEKQLREIQARIKRTTRPTRSLHDKLKEATVAVEMSRYYEDAFALSSLLTKWATSLEKGHRFVVCSGGGPGIMEAANKGALLAGGKSIGLNISLPHEQESNDYLSPNLNFEFHYFFMRKLWFVTLAEALVMFPGGFGTLDEMMEVLTLKQTRKVRSSMPVILYGSSYWKQAINFDFLIKCHTISKNDAKLFHFADTPDEAFRLLKKELTKHLRANR